MTINNLNVSKDLDSESISTALFWLPAITAASMAPLKAANHAAQAGKRDVANAATGVLTGTTNMVDRTVPMGASGAAADSAQDLADSAVPEWVEQTFGPRACWLPVICN